MIVVVLFLAAYITLRFVKPQMRGWRRAAASVCVALVGWLGMSAVTNLLM